MKILIADDEEPMATILKNFLRVKGYGDVDVFFSGTAAIRAVTKPAVEEIIEKYCESGIGYRKN